jgi:chaperonin cofactor prefoldin
MKDYRTALTRNLLSNVVTANAEDASYRPAPAINPIFSSPIDRLPYATVAQTMPLNSNDVLFKKLDSILTKAEEESTATRQSLGELKEEMRNHYEEIKQQVDVLENMVKTMEKKFEDLSMRIFTILQNICTSLLDPNASQSATWKSYWKK